MEPSLFLEWINRYFPGLVLRAVENLNGTTNPLTYLHRRMLRPEFSVSGKWESLSAAFSLVAADVIAMDSSIPLKMRDAIAKATGDIPKMGMELALRETQLTELYTLSRMQGAETQFLAKLFADTPRVIGGIYERLEAIFLEGLSTGVVEIEDTETVGTAIRVDFRYPAANRFGAASVIWSNAASTPFADMQRVLTAANLKGVNITRVMLDRTALTNMAATTEVKQLFAFNLGFAGSTIPSPSFAQLNELGRARLGVTFELVDRSVVLERNGVRTPFKPWADGIVVMLAQDQVGSLVYARLAEQDAPVDGVTYVTADNFILASKFRTNRPSLAEFTNSQARVVPVIGNVDQIFIIDTKTVQA
jgi:hypothetical protein